MSQTQFGLAAIGIIATAVLLFAIFGNKINLLPKYNYSAKTSILSPAEKQFLRILQAQMPSGWILMSQVRYADLFDITEKDEKRRKKALNKIMAKSADFVICDPDYRPHLIIELNDKTHELRHRRNRDIEISYIAERANIPVYFQKVQKVYNVSEIRTAFIAHQIPVTSAPSTTKS